VSRRSLPRTPPFTPLLKAFLIFPGLPSPSVFRSSPTNKYCPGFLSPGALFSSPALVPGTISAKPGFDERWFTKPRSLPKTPNSQIPTTHQGKRTHRQCNRVKSPISLPPEYRQFVLAEAIPGNLYKIVQEGLYKFPTNACRVSPFSGTSRRELWHPLPSYPLRPPPLEPQARSIKRESSDFFRDFFFRPPPLFLHSFHTSAFMLFSPPECIRSLLGVNPLLFCIYRG